MRFSLLFVVALLGACGGPAPRDAAGDDVVATFSIAAFDPETGDLGVAVQSKFFGVGVVVPWVRADVGAVATQALANPAYGPDGLAGMDDGLPPAEIVKRLVEADPGRERRQVGMVDWKGRAAAFTGKQTLPWSGHVIGEGYCCQGNILAGEAVVKDMAKAFEDTEGPLAERLVAALAAGQAAGGDKRGRQSAALVVKRRGGGYLGANDRYIDLRVDDHPKPIEELGRLLKLRRALGRDAPPPERPKFAGREPRMPYEGNVGPRAVWERWRRRWVDGDWEGVMALANSHYREEHTLEELRKAHEEPKAPQVRALRGTYVSTRLVAESGQLTRAALWFALPRERELLMVLMVREKGAWRIVP